jgi:hypothetical protein
MVFPFTPNFVDLRPCGASSTNPLCAGKASGDYPDNPFERSNPLETAALMQNDEKVWRFLAGGNAVFQALNTQQHELRFTFSGGLDYFTHENELLFPPELQFEPVDDGLAGTSLLSKSDNQNANLNGNFVYAYLGGSYRATSSGGVSYEDEDLNIARIVSRNLIAGKPNVDAGTTFELREFRRRVKDVGLHFQEDVLMSGERLLLSAGVSAYKSSSNGDHEKFFAYPKFAASYRIPNIAADVSELKLRAAWGQSGNRPLFGQKFTPLSGTRNIEGLPGLVPVGTAGDVNIEPERQKEIEAGLDVVMFGERVSFEITGFQKNITNLLLERELAPSSGFTLQVFNGASCACAASRQRSGQSAAQQGPQLDFTRDVLRGQERGREPAGSFLPHRRLRYRAGRLPDRGRPLGDGDRRQHRRRLSGYLRDGARRRHVPRHSRCSGQRDAGFQNRLVERSNRGSAPFLCTARLATRG